MNELCFNSYIITITILCGLYFVLSPIIMYTYYIRIIRCVTSLLIEKFVVNIKTELISGVQGCWPNRSSNVTNRLNLYEKNKKIFMKSCGSVIFYRIKVCQSQCQWSREICIYIYYLGSKRRKRNKLKVGGRIFFFFL